MTAPNKRLEHYTARCGGVKALAFSVQEAMLRFHAIHVEVSSQVGGEYLQVSFSVSDADDSAYVLIQRSFEGDASPCYFECHNVDLAGHGVIKRCELRRDSIEIDLKQSPEHVSVAFEEPDDKIASMGWMLDRIFGGDASFSNVSGVVAKAIDATG